MNDVPSKNKVTIVMPGQGELKEEIEKKAKEYGIDLRLVGFKKQTDMIDLYGATDVFVLPSLSDPNSTVFAMGGSAIAEWYWNFGWYGIPLTLVFALFICKIEQKIYCSAYKPVWFGTWVSFLYYLMRYTRGYFNEIVWQPIYVFLFVALIQVVLIKTSPRKRKVVRG